MTPLARLAALGRRILWRVIFSVTGGIGVRGSFPRGGSVIVANHTSHADTAALLAAVPCRQRVRVAAAADYWFGGGWRPKVCRALVGGFPVRRRGGGGADLAAMLPLLRAGYSVVVFPEGTRSTNGSIGEFRGGAMRLAAQAGVPVVPVGLVGTSRLLPAHGRFRRSAVSVHVGTPMRTSDPAAVRAEVARLAGEGSVRPDSELRRRVATLAAGRWGVLIVATWAVLEALSWPIVPEVALFVALLAWPRAGLRLTTAAVAGSLLGGLVCVTLARHGLVAPEPMVTPRMQAVVAEQTSAQGAAAVTNQPFAGIPYKVYAAEAGRAGVDVPTFISGSLTGRGLRIAMIGGLLTLIGFAGQRLRRFYPAVMLVCLTGFGVGLGMVVASWS